MTDKTEGGKSTTVFYTDSTIVFSPITLHRDLTELLLRTEQILVDQSMPKTDRCILRISLIFTSDIPLS